jgi:N-acetylmuramoyl-L-alanine amidase
MPDNQFTISGSLLNGESKKLIRMDDEMRNRSSLNLAWMIQNNIMHLTQQKKIELVDRSVKRAVSQILAGSAMPSVLVEIGFLTNVQEAEKLGTKEYKLLLAQGISEGISRYVFHNFSDNFSLRNG